jgi:hypothetical protein
MTHDQESPPGSAATATPAEMLSQQPRSRWRQCAYSAWAVALLVLVLYGVLLLKSLAFGGDPRDFIVIGQQFIQRAGPSALITPDPNYHYTRNGYDGQFCYYIALDPINARSYVDDPAYRYTRILYPITARLLALGQPALLPYTLILLNWLALGGGTLAVAVWLARKGSSPWFALVYGLYPGLFIGLQRDLTEPLAYALVALAVYLFAFGGRCRFIWAALSFALAALARESTAVFALVYGLAVVFEPGGALRWQERLSANWRRALIFSGLALGPLVLYKGFLLLWLHSPGLPADLSPEVLPFGGMVALWPWHTNQIAALVCIIFPALICAGMGFWALWRRAWSVEVWALLVNIQLFVVMLAAPPYREIFGSERVTTGVVLAACCCVPGFDRLTGGRRWWFWSASVLWQALIPLLVLLNPV